MTCLVTSRPTETVGFSLLLNNFTLHKKTQFVSLYFTDSAQYQDVQYIELRQRLRVVFTEN